MSELGKSFEKNLDKNKKIQDVLNLEEENEQQKLYERYKIILETRKFEIDNFWKRALFFWGTLAALFFAVVNVKESNSQYSIFLVYLGAFYNLIFSLSIRGSKFWQQHWEDIAEASESGLDRLPIFKTESIFVKKKRLELPILFRPYRFSVSKLVMIQSDSTILFWILMIIHELDKLITSKKLLFCWPTKHCSFDFYSFSVFIVPVLLFCYLGFFYKTERKRGI